MNPSVLQVFAPVTRRLEADAAEYFGRGPVRLVPVACLDRPFSHVLRVAVRRLEGDTPVSYLFVKVFKPKLHVDAEALRRRVIDDYETTRRAYLAMRQRPDIGVVPPVACYPELLTIATEEVSGPTLLNHLCSQAAWFPTASRLDQLRETMITVGRWIRAFQTTKTTDESATTEQLRAYIDLRLQRLVQQVGERFDERNREDVLRHLDRLGRQIATSELREVAVHSDLALGNIIVSGHRIVVLDFAMAKLGNHLHDLTRLCVQIELLGVKPQLRGRVLRRLRDALLHGFDPSLTSDGALFRLLLMLHRVNQLTKLSAKRTGFPEAVYHHLVRRQHRRWIAQQVLETRGSQRT